MLSGHTQTLGNTNASGLTGFMTLASINRKMWCSRNENFTHNLLLPPFSFLQRVFIHASRVEEDNKNNKNHTQKIKLRLQGSGIGDLVQQRFVRCR